MTEPARNPPTVLAVKIDPVRMPGPGIPALTAQQLLDWKKDRAARGLGPPTPPLAKHVPVPVVTREKLAQAVASVPIGPKEKPAPSPLMAKQGPILWMKLHTEMLKFGTLTKENKPDVLAWLTKFRTAIPCGECSAGWNKIYGGNPPTIGCDLFAWSVDRHNDVNRKLWREEWSVERAREKWAV